MAPPVSLTTFLWRIAYGNGQSRCLCSGLAQGSIGRYPVARFGRSPPKPRSDQFGRAEMGEPELELAVIELVRARFPDLFVLEGRSLVSATFHRLEAVEG